MACFDPSLCSLLNAGSNSTRSCDTVIYNNIYIYGKSWILKFKKLIEHLSISMQKDLLQDIILKLSKVNDSVFLLDFVYLFLERVERKERKRGRETSMC